LQDTDKDEEQLTIEEMEAREAAEREEQRIKSAVDNLAQRLEKEATDIEGKKSAIQDRWYECTRQYYGKLDPETEKALIANKRSRLFVHMTRPKTDNWIARVLDLLFPSDEKNWGMEPTPEPELKGYIDAKPQLEEGQEPTEEQRVALEKAKAAENYFEEARVRSKAMVRECDDQLTESKYAAECRKVIEWAFKLGTGVLKGPVDVGKKKRVWVQDEAGEHNLIAQDFAQPSYKNVDPWNFFPDPNATEIEDAEFTFERHLLTKKQLKQWAKNPDFDQDTIRELLIDGAKGNIPDYVSQIRTIADGEKTAIEKRFVVWEYRGPLEDEELEDLFKSSGMEDEYNALKLDPLVELDVVVYVCQGRVIRFGIHHLDSNEPIYSVFNFAKDSASIWGWGIPALMRDSQKALNAAWRMMMDNGAIAAGPQIVIDKELVEPENGNWDMTPFKVWLATADPSGRKPFDVHDITSNQGDLAGIVALAKEHIDEEISLPAPAQGEQGGQVGNTVQGLAMLMNSSNVIFRRVVRNFDDDLTVPSLGRLYQWNMQFSDKEDIKGDMQVDARGSSVLLVRELQSTNIMALLQLTENPRFEGWLKEDVGLEKVVQSMLLRSTDLLRTKEERETWLQERAKEQEAQAQNQGLDPEQVKWDIAQLESNSRMYVADLNHETAMISLAENSEMKLEQLQAMLTDKREERASRERVMAGEAGFKLRLAKEEAAGTAREVGGTRYGGSV
jgi:hypothetical protein